MRRIPRKSDGRRVFTEAFKREQIDRVLRGDLTLGELSEKLGIARSLLHRWKRAAEGTQRDGRGNGNPVSELRADLYVRELQRLVGKQALELELLRAELSTLRKARRAMKVPA